MMLLKQPPTPLSECPELLVRHLAKCHCLKQPHSGSAAHCLRKSQVTFFQSDATGACRRRVWRGFIPCGPRACDDKDDSVRCLARKRKGQCRLPAVFIRCKRTCGRCRCQGLELTKTPCQKDGTRHVYAVHYRRHKGHGRCIVSYRTWKQRCPCECLERCTD